MAVLVLQSDRIFGMATLAYQPGAVANADTNVQLTLPTNFGDCLVLEWVLDITAGTPAADAVITARGAALSIITPAGLTIDHLGTNRYVITSAGLVHAQAYPDQAAIFRTNEQLNLYAANISTAGNNTLELFIRVKRLRQLGP